MNIFRAIALGLVILLVHVAVAGDGGNMIALRGGELTISLSDDGRLTGIQGPPGGRELLYPGERPIFLNLGWDGKMHRPSAFRFDRAAGKLEVVYDGDVTATVEVRAAPTHIRFTLVSVTGAEPERLTLLHLPIGVRGSVGTAVGVIRDDSTAVGVQALNIHSEGGAAERKYGGVLFTFARKDRGGVIGASAALFACPPAKALDRIGRIELAEGLPHPMLDGQWNKVSPAATSKYLVIAFGRSDIEQVIALAGRGGFRYVYHPGPFDTWGHFVLKKRQFPEGDKSLRECSELAAKAGIRLGVHTLSGFITTNDAYVTPVPDPRLARIGSSTLAADIDADATEIPVEDAAPFRRRQTLGGVIMGKELASYEKVVEGSPPKLVGVQRGAWGTTASPHKRGDDIGKLADHPYKTFFPGIANGMMDEMTDRLVELVNYCNLHMLSFDGLEGLSTYEGGGDYPRNRFVDRCHRRWKPEVISGASNLLHYTWHWHGRMNWGEITQSAKMDIDHYRYMRCEFYRKNLLPPGMGWWRIGTLGPAMEATRLEDAEYLLAKAAGNGAAHALTTHLGVIESHGRAARMFELAKQWDEARRAGAFSDEQLARLRERGRDFHLRAAGPGRWELTPVEYSPFYWYCSGAGRKAKSAPLTFASAGKPRPAQPFEVDNPHASQPLLFEIRCLPAYDYEHPRNIDLTPDPAGLVRERGLHKEAPVVDVSRDGEIAGRPALRLSAEYEGAGKPSFVTRLCRALPEPLDLSKNRGIGLWVEGDGKGETLFVEIQDGRCVRPFYVPIDFTGERYIELPLGEVSLKRYYDYEWNNWSSFASWWVTLKGFRYNRVQMVTLGFNAIPPRTKVSCRVAGIKALRELPAKVTALTLQAVERKMSISPGLEPFQYLLCEQPGAVQVCDANFHTLRTVEPSGRVVLAPGKNPLSLSCECEGPAPWLRLQVKCLGEPEAVGK